MITSQQKSDLKLLLYLLLRDSVYIGELETAMRGVEKTRDTHRDYETEPELLEWLDVMVERLLSKEPRSHEADPVLTV